MNAYVDQAPRRSRFTLFLTEELRSRPGRLAACMRIAGGCIAIVILGMTFQIPLPAYMAYLVFLVSRDEQVSTLTTGIASVLGATLAIVLTLALYIVDAGEPALRLPLMALSCFAAMYLVRTCTLGPIAFLAGFILVLSQTLIDDVPSTEYLVRFILWLWLVLSLPAVLTVIVDMTLGARPLRMAAGQLGTLFDELADCIDGRKKADFWQLQAALQVVRQLRETAHKYDAGLRDKWSIDEHLLDRTGSLIALVTILPSSMTRDLRILLSGTLREYKAALIDRSGFPITLLRIPPELLRVIGPDVAVVAKGIGKIINDLIDGALKRQKSEGRAEPLSRSLFVKDAFVNRAYARFALKTTTAVMICYATYTLLDWPGIRTSVTTCFFVALGSFGETAHKLSLRLSGALIGGLIAGLCLVFVIPFMTDIGQLCVLVALVSMACAWVATSSARLSYAGMQMAFAFFLGIFQGYGPPTDLTELRDRVVGILLGNIVMTVVFTTLWPVSAAQLARVSLGGVFSGLASMLGSTERKISFSGLMDGLLRTRSLLAISMFERPFVAKGMHAGLFDEEGLNQIARLSAVAMVLMEQSESGQASVASNDAGLVEWLGEVGQRLAKNSPIPAFIKAEVETENSPDRAGNAWAISLLSRECEHVASLF